jgi:outer membrane protein OmpA-like peptidoglycan-associated protein
MKNRLLLVLMALAIVPGCGWRKKKSSEDNTTARDYKQTGSKSVFDEDVEAFVLEEDQNPFASGTNEEVKLAEEGSLWNPSDRQGDYETVYFDFNRYNIRPDQKAALDRDVKNIKAATENGKIVMIEGHACVAGGSAKYNMTLSEKRAKTVKDYLTSKGVAADKLKTVGRGSEMLKVVGGSEEQQAPNRRVEFYVLEQ